MLLFPHVLSPLKGQTSLRDHLEEQMGQAWQLGQSLVLSRPLKDGHHHYHQYNGLIGEVSMDNRGIFPVSLFKHITWLSG